MSKKYEVKVKVSLWVSANDEKEAEILLGKVEDAIYEVKPFWCGHEECCGKEPDTPHVVGLFTSAKIKEIKEEED